MTRNSATPRGLRTVGLSLVLLTAACSSGGQTSPDTAATSPASAPAEVSTEAPDEASGSGEITVDKVGFALSAAGDFQFANAVALVTNGTDEVVALNVSFAAYGAGDEVLAQSETSAPVARAGATVATTVPLEIPAGSTVERVEARTNALFSETEESPDSRFVGAEATFRKDEFVENTGSVTGTITSEYEDSVNDVYVAAVCYDASDNIIGGGEGYTNVPTGQTVPVEVQVTTTEPARCDLVPTLGGASTAVE